MIQGAPENKRAVRQPATNAVPQFHVTQKLGFKPVVTCLCGATFDLNTGTRTAFQAFQQAHCECRPKENHASNS